MRPLQAHARLALGGLLRRTGRVVPARAELLSAGELFRAMEMTSGLRRAEAELAHVHSR